MLNSVLKEHYFYFCSYWFIQCTAVITKTCHQRHFVFARIRINFSTNTTKLLSNFLWHNLYKFLKITCTRLNFQQANENDAVVLSRNSGNKAIQVSKEWIKSISHIENTSVIKLKMLTNIRSATYELSAFSIASRKCFF